MGDSIRSGHYRAFWPQPVSGMMVSDDFVSPSLAGPSDLTRIYKGSYLVFLSRCEL